MSLFRVIKYSSILFFLGKYKHKLFRVVVVLLFALATSILYQDVADYLRDQYPGSVVYALIAKIIIVYGALAFVLWQFKPEAEKAPVNQPAETETEAAASDRLSRLEDIEAKDKLASRYQKVIDGKPPPRP